LLVMLTDSLQLVLLGWQNTNSNQVVTKGQVDLCERIGRPLERREGPLIRIDKDGGRSIAIMVMQGVMTWLRLRYDSTSGNLSISKAHKIRVEALQVIDFVIGKWRGHPAASSVVIQLVDEGPSSTGGGTGVTNERFLYFFVLVEGTSTSNSSSHTSNSNPSAGMWALRPLPINPVAVDASVHMLKLEDGILWALGAGKIYRFPSNSPEVPLQENDRLVEHSVSNLSTSSTLAIKNFQMQGDRILSICTLAPKMRWLFVDNIGMLYLAAISSTTKNLLIESLGQLSTLAHCLAILTRNGHVFIGSTLGDHQIIQLEQQAISPHTYFTLLETIQNLGPLVDLHLLHSATSSSAITADASLIPSQPLDKMLVACGAGRTAALALKQEGFSLNNHLDLCVRLDHISTDISFDAAPAPKKSRPSHFPLLSFYIHSIWAASCSSALLFSTSNGIFHYTDALSFVPILNQENESVKYVDEHFLYTGKAIYEVNEKKDFKLLLSFERNEIIQVICVSPANQYYLIDECGTIYNYTQRHLTKMGELTPKSVPCEFLKESSIENSVHMAFVESDVVSVASACWFLDTLYYSIWQDPNNLYAWEEQQPIQAISLTCASFSIIVDMQPLDSHHLLIARSEGSLYILSFNNTSREFGEAASGKVPRVTRLMGAQPGFLGFRQIPEGILVSYRERLFVALLKDKHRAMIQPIHTGDDQAKAFYVTAPCLLNGRLYMATASSKGTSQDPSLPCERYATREDALRMTSCILSQQAATFQKTAIGDTIVTVLPTLDLIIVLAENSIRTFRTDTMTSVQNIALADKISAGIFLPAPPPPARHHRMGGHGSSGYLVIATLDHALSLYGFQMDNLVCLCKTPLLATAPPSRHATSTMSLSPMNPPPVLAMQPASSTSFLVAVGPQISQWHIRRSGGGSGSSHVNSKRPSEPLDTICQMAPERQNIAFGQILPLFFHRQADLLLVGDLMKSVSLFQMIQSTHHPVNDDDTTMTLEGLKEVARDFNPRWLTAMTALTAELYLVADTAALYLLQRQPATASAIERARLHTVSSFPMTQLVQKLIPLHQQPYQGTCAAPPFPTFRILAITAQGSILLITIQPDFSFFQAYVTLCSKHPRIGSPLNPSSSHTAIQADFMLQMKSHVSQADLDSLLVSLYP
jgi:Mono-functional DNA-alkylating methyl methanesulfonate N-term/CPSF A subunit region